MSSSGAKYRAVLRRCGLAVLAVAIVVVAHIPAFAAAPADYKKRVESARVGVEQLFAGRSTSGPDVEHDSVTEIQRLIPPTENIEWPGGSVETDNRWLRARLADFAAETDKTKRGAMLTEISERLAAVSAAADDLERAARAPQTKDEDKQKLAEILRRAEYQKPEAAEKSLFQKWLDEFLDWLARVFPKPASAPQTPSGFGSLKFVLQILVYVVVIGLVGFLIYKFAPFLSGRFGNRKKQEKRDRVILGERIGADESASDLFSDAERLARDGNPRAAIRKGYIAMLCDLSDRKIVRLARHKTNRDYLRDVRKDSGLFENMTGLTRNFESNWYGLKAAKQADWEEFRTRYLRTIGGIRR